MRIAILGATSQIAKDLVQSFSTLGQHELTLYARSPERVRLWLASVGLAGRHAVAEFSAFSTEVPFDALINFVGVGNPAQAAAMGAAIFDVTLQYDEMALRYVRQNPVCRYLFLSSGAAYGSSFTSAVNEATQAQVAINALQPQDWYAVAKLHAECRHRALTDLAIIDLRVFNYFSRTQDLSARFLMTDIVRAIRDQSILATSSAYIVRDFLHPADFHQLVSVLLAAPAINQVVDCYSRAPIDKSTLLACMQQRFGLQYQVVDSDSGVNATGIKPYYYSLNTRAASFGFSPVFSSQEGVEQEVAAILQPSIQANLL